MHKYTILSLNDDRQKHKEQIRRVVTGEEILVKTTDGRNVNLAHELKYRGLWMNEVWNNAKVGEVGVWLSNYDRWRRVATMEEPLIVFEDDAIPDLDFNNKVETLLKELPTDWDFCSLWVPPNQSADYLYNIVYNEIGEWYHIGNLPVEQSNYRVEGSDKVAFAYQGYGMVALMYSPKGGTRLMERARTTGLYTPVDCWVFEQAKRGFLRGYSPTPWCADIVHYDWSAPSHVQQTERVE